MTKISEDFDFMRKIVFKMLCMYNKGGRDDEMIAKIILMQEWATRCGY